jgi:hypothetical protein
MAIARALQNYETEIVRLLDLANKQSKDISEIMKQDHEIIARIDDTLQRIKFNTQ